MYNHLAVTPSFICVLHLSCVYVVTPFFHQSIFVVFTYQSSQHSFHLLLSISFILSTVFYRIHFFDHSPSHSQLPYLVIVTLSFSLNFTICYLFHNGGPCHVETSPLIYSVNQWTGFSMIGTSVVKELRAMTELKYIFI